MKKLFLIAYGCGLSMLASAMIEPPTAPVTIPTGPPIIPAIPPPISQQTTFIHLFNFCKNMGCTEEELALPDPLNLLAQKDALYLPTAQEDNKDCFSFADSFVSDLIAASTKIKLFANEV